MEVQKGPMNMTLVVFGPGLTDYPCIAGNVTEQAKLQNASYPIAGDPYLRRSKLIRHGVFQPHLLAL